LDGTEIFRHGGGLGGLLLAGLPAQGLLFLTISFLLGCSISHRLLGDRWLKCLGGDFPTPEPG
jgi:hypothetical protein